MQTCCERAQLKARPFHPREFHRRVSGKGVSLHFTHNVLAFVLL